MTENTASRKRPNNWHRIALVKILGSKCMKCNSQERLEVHHKDGNPWNNDRSNLELRCEDCHLGRGAKGDKEKPIKLTVMIDKNLDSQLREHITNNYGPNTYGKLRETVEEALTELIYGEKEKLG